MNADQTLGGTAKQLLFPPEFIREHPAVDP
jgi:hypothetical protein